MYIMKGRLSLKRLIKKFSAGIIIAAITLTVVFVYNSQVYPSDMLFNNSADTYNSPSIQTDQNENNSNQNNINTDNQNIINEIGITVNTTSEPKTETKTQATERDIIGTDSIIFQQENSNATEVEPALTTYSMDNLKD